MAGAGRQGREREKRGQQALKHAPLTDGFHEHFPLIWGMRDVFIIKMFKKDAAPTQEGQPQPQVCGERRLRRPRSTAHSSVPTALHGETEAQLARR